MDKLPGDYVAGFVDGEGCFALKFRRDVRHDRKNKPVYFYWDIEFAIYLHGDDIEILERIKKTLNCGRVGNLDKRGNVRYAVNDIKDLSEKLVPFFEKYNLQAKKKNDFELWKEAVELFLKNQRHQLNRDKKKSGFHKTEWNKSDIERLKEIHNGMTKYKTGAKAWKWLDTKVS